MKFICFCSLCKICLQTEKQYLFILFIGNSNKQNMIEKANKIAKKYKK
jgi:hypothetical protein